MNDKYEVETGQDGSPIVKFDEPIDKEWMQPVAMRQAACHNEALRERVGVEVAPGITVSKHLIDAAAPPSPPPSRAAKRAADAWSREIAETRKDLDISKQLVESLVAGNVIEERRRSEAEDLLVKDMQRQQDMRTAFVNVTGLKPIAAAAKVLDMRNRVGVDDVRPVDLTDVLDGTRPVINNEIDQVARLIQVRLHTPSDQLPDDISFYVPNVDLPQAHDDTSTLRYDRTRYVHLDSMPPELRDVVNAYISMRRRTGEFERTRFKKVVRTLAEKTEVTMGPDLPENAQKD